MFLAINPDARNNEVNAMSERRNTFADIGSVTYRIRQAAAMLGVTDVTLRGYSENFDIRRASDTNPGSPPIRIYEPAQVFEIAQWRRSQGYIKVPQTHGKPFVAAVTVCKGGTGKTVTAVELAVELQLVGFRTLLIDLDSQASATQIMGYEPDIMLEEAESFGLSEVAVVQETLAHVLDSYVSSTQGGRVRHVPHNIKGLIKKPFGEHGPHLVPADTFLSNIERLLLVATGNRERFLRNMLDEAAKGSIPGFEISGYDLIILDCPPTVSTTSSSGMVAADMLIAPIRMDVFSIKGISKMISEIHVFKPEWEIEPDLIILPTHYSTNVARISRMRRELETYSDNVSPYVISVSEDIPNSQERSMPLSITKPTSVPACEYRAFASYIREKIIERLAKTKGGRK